MRRVAGALASLIVLLAARPAPALFHASLIDEVMSRVGSDATAQYVEIRMLASTQNLVTNTRLTAFNCNGTSHTVLLLVPGPNPPNSGANVRWIMATSAFQSAHGVTADFTMPAGIPIGGCAFAAGWLVLSRLHVTGLSFLLALALAVQLVFATVTEARRTPRKEATSQR